jgi:hypothetical protein
VEVGGSSTVQRAPPNPAPEFLEAPLCVVPRSKEMQDLEQRLQFAMVAYVGGGRPLVSCDLVHDMLVRRLGLPREGFSVHPYRSEDFLIVFSMAEM